MFVRLVNIMDTCSSIWDKECTYVIMFLTSIHEGGNNYLLCAIHQYMSTTGGECCEWRINIATVRHNQYFQRGSVDELP